jgi:hypothetical protein
VLPGARLVELTPKSVDRERHAAEVQRCLEAFLGRFTAPGPSSPGRSVCAPASLSFCETADRPTLRGDFP